MPFVIVGACIDVKDRTCIEGCPVDCLYESGRRLYVNPDECIDCGACEPVCRVEAIYPEREVPRERVDFVSDNPRFFTDVLPGHDEPLGLPGGGAIFGALSVDTPFTVSWTDESE
jgi:NAD-dependent dihydropyrimidine dehydrogenase PreA subunit